LAAGGNLKTKNGLVTTYTANNDVKDYVFYGCNSLKSIEFKEGCTSIGKQSFGKCSLTSVNVPNTVTAIQEGAFGECSGITNVTVPFIGSGTEDTSTFGYIFGTTAPETIDSFIETE
jgi:hypothetical protein